MRRRAVSALEKARIPLSSLAARALYHEHGRKHPVAFPNVLPLAGTTRPH